MSHASADAIDALPKEVSELTTNELKATIYNIIDGVEAELSDLPSLGGSRDPMKVIKTMANALDSKVDVLSAQSSTMSTFLHYDHDKMPGQIEDVREAIHDIIHLALEADHALIALERKMNRGVTVE